MGQQGESEDKRTRVYSVGAGRLQVVAHSDGQPRLRITDASGAAEVVVYLNEVRHLIDVLATAGADLAGEIAGDPPVEPLFLGGEQIGWGVKA